MSKTIKISDSAHTRLGRRVRLGKTLGDVIEELLDMADRSEEKGGKKHK